MGGRGGDYAAASAGGGSYHAFDGLPVAGYYGGWQYDGDGQDEMDFFFENSNFDDMINQMSEDDKQAFKMWARGAFMDGQQYDGWDNMTNLEKERTQRYDRILDNAELKKGIELRRLSDAQLVLGAGNKMPSMEDLKAMEGQYITAKGSMSFAAAKRGLTIGDTDKKVEYVLKIPPGKGAGMWIGSGAINDWGSQQREFMTNRDISIKVGKTRYNKDRGIYEVELEFGGRQKHDYGKSGKLKLS